MLGSQKVVLINTAVTAASNPGAEAPEADIVSPHDRDALEQFADQWDMGKRLPSLMRSAARSRDLAEVHRCVAREAIIAARSAKSNGDHQLFRHLFETVQEARRKAWDCFHFSSQCEERAQAIMSSGRGA
jgi:hypothetical protein